MAQIGQLNGKWAILFKAVLSVSALALPSVMALNIWFVTEIYNVKTRLAVMNMEIAAFIGSGPRYTPAMARTDNLLLKDEILKEVARSYPPQWLVDDLRDTLTRIKALEGRP